jgi:hypothetical protein
VSIGSPSERKSAPFVSSVSIGAGSVLAEDFSATEVLKIQDLPLGGLILRTHSGVADDGHDPLPLFRCIAAQYRRSGGLFKPRACC